MDLERFDRLEEGISRLLGMCEELKDENRALKEAVVENRPRYGNSPAGSNGSIRKRRRYGKRLTRSSIGSMP